MRGRDGQSTLEYLLVLGAFVAMLAALAALWRAGREGDLVGKATAASSHGAGQGVVALLEDVLGF